MRNVARTAEGEQIDELVRASKLFDWIVRNIQLDAKESPATQFARTPGQTLLLGHGDARDRAWLFVAMARQAYLDVVVLGFANPADSQDVKFWLPALLLEDQLYLFDTRLGLAVPGPDGQPVATLEQVVVDAGLLRQLDLDESHPYPVTADDLSHVVALVEASPPYLARRMEIFENNLAGARKLVLTVQADELLERLRALPHVADARLWSLPFESIVQQSNFTREQQQTLLYELQPFQMPALWNGRLHHLKGLYVGDNSANHFYQAARPPDEEIETQVPDMQGQMLIKSAKRNASFWLGLVAFERGRYQPAIEHFTKRTLEASPGGPWTHGARYNIARAHEASGNVEEAIRILETDNSPQRHGNRLRARLLRESLAPSAATEQPAELTSEADDLTGNSADPVESTTPLPPVEPDTSGDSSEQEPDDEDPTASVSSDNAASP